MLSMGPDPGTRDRGWQRVGVFVEGGEEQAGSPSKQNNYFLSLSISPSRGVSLDEAGRSTDEIRRHDGVGGLQVMVALEDRLLGLVVSSPYASDEE
jgi:hypothetical protein